MYTRSTLFLLALFLGSVYANDLNASSPLVKRTPETLQNRAAAPIAAADSLSGLIEIRAPSDFDLIARSPTPVAAADPEPAPQSGPIPARGEDAADSEGPFALPDDSPLLEYEGAEVLQKRAACPA